MVQAKTAITLPALLQITIMLVGILLLSHCSPEKPSPTSNGLEAGTTSTLANSDFLPEENNSQLSPKQGLIALASARTDHSLAAARATQEAIETLLTSPQAHHLTQAQARWRKLFNHLHQLLPLLHLKHKASSDLDNLAKWRFAISAWPIQPGYIDSYKNYFHSGIVNDINIPISRSVLRQQHGLTDAEEVLLGIHAIEYILWGEQGSRTFKHFIPLNALPEKLNTSGIDIKQLPNNRRRRLLALQIQILSNDLRALQRQWQAGNSITKSYQKLSQQQRLVAINHSVAHYLQQWSTLLKEEATPKHIDVRLNDFAGKRLQGLQNGLKTITTIYLNNRILLDGQLLKKSDREQFQQLVNAITAALKDDTLNHKPWSAQAISTLTTPIDQAISILKSSLTPPARIEANE